MAIRRTTLGSYANHWDSHFNASLQSSIIFCRHVAATDFQYSLHSHLGVEFILCLSGVGVFRAGQELLPCQGPAIIHHNGMLPHGLNMGHDYEHWNICIEPDAYGQVVPSATADWVDFSCPTGVGITGIDEQYGRRLETLFTDIAFELEHKPPYYEEIVAIRLQELLRLYKRLLRYPAGLHQTASKTSPQCASDSLLDIQTFIDTHLSKRLNADMLAATFNYSPQHIYRLVRQITGYSLHDYIKRRRVERAKGLLETTHLSVTAIANMVGFPDVAYFSRTFHQLTGLTPSQYRQLWHFGPEGKRAVQLEQ
jgi:AraC-like DNA-binding protein